MSVTNFFATAVCASVLLAGVQTTITSSDEIQTARNQTISAKKSGNSSGLAASATALMAANQKRDIGFLMFALGTAGCVLSSRRLKVTTPQQTI